MVSLFEEYGDCTEAKPTTARNLIYREETVANNKILIN